MTTLDQPPLTTEADPLLAELARTPDAPPASHFRGTDRYRVRRRLGEGSFGVVYEVLDQKLDRRLALKLLKESRGGKIEWLKKEFRSVADLVHENLVGLHELVSEDGRWFITMDLVEGVDFSTHVDGPGASSEDLTAEIRADRDQRFVRLRSALRQLARGVEAIHAAGKLHRDLKPPNVLVDARGRVVILDFGLAHDIRRNELLTVEQATAGTPQYMAPEQLQGEPATRASDWYAVGVMLYEALAGKRPFGGSSAQLARNKAENDPAPPSTEVGGVPDDLERLCMALLSREPAARPTGADVLAQLGEEAVRPAQPINTEPPELVGRTDALRELQACASKMLQGQPAAIFVHGEPGVGKTAVCEHFLGHLRSEHGALVLPARCYERESVPFKAVDGVVDALAVVLRKLSRAEAAALMPRDVHLLARLFPVLDSVPALKAVPVRASDSPDPQQLRRRAFAALKELLGRLADKQPLVVFIDDLQWSDLDSTRLLAELLGPPDPPALLFVGSYRTTGREQSEALAALLTDPSGSGREHPEIQLEGLTPKEAVAFARTLGEGLDQDELEKLAREAQGHPLFMAELIRTRGTQHDGRASLREIIMSRVAQLQQDARSLLEVVSVAGQPLAQQVCLEAAGVGATGPDLMRLLTARQLVRTSGPSERDWVQPYHDRVREAVVEATAPPSAREHHLALALSLQRRDGDAETLAEHFDAGGDLEHAGKYATIAADAASDALAFDRAAKLYQLALDRLAPQGGERAALLNKLATALANAGRGADAGRAFSSAAEASEGDTRDLRRQAAEQLLVSGREREGLDVLLPLLAEMGIKFPKTTGRAVARMVWTDILMSLRGMKFREATGRVSPEVLLRLDVLESAARGLEFHDIWRACGFYNEHTLLALKTGEPHRVARALPNFIPARSMSKGINDSARKASTEALALAEELDDPRAMASIYRNLALSAGYASGLWREGVEHFEHADRILVERCAGNMRDIRFCRMKSALGRLRLGELRELGARCDAHLREAIDRGDHLARTALQIYSKAPLLLAADEPETARRVLGSAELPSQGVFRLYHACTMSDSYLYEGDVASAVAVWAEWWPQYKAAKMGFLPLFALDSVRCHAAALIAAGDDASLKQAAKLAKTLKADHVHGMRGTRECILGCIAAKRGQSDQAQQLLASAASAFDEAEMKLLAASCRRTQGVLGNKPGLVEAADAVMRSEGIVRPDRWAAMTAPIG
jgi:hypothetical protein